MRASTIDWIQHGNMPINSVDVQPRGYRVLTGGNDNKVCIWNLLPILQRKYEVLGRPDSQSKTELDGPSGGKPEKSAQMGEDQKVEAEIEGSSWQVS